MNAPAVERRARAMAKRMRARVKKRDGLMLIDSNDRVVLGADYDATPEAIIERLERRAAAGFHWL